MQIKNNHSSKGKPAITNPVVYSRLNHHTPIAVNHTSQAMKGTATRVAAFKKDIKCLSNLILLSKEAIKQMIIVKNKTSK